MVLLRTLLVITVLFPVLLTAQPRWVDEGGPYGGNIVDIVRWSGGYMAAPGSRPFVLLGSIDGAHWEMRTMPHGGTGVFRLLESQGRLLAGGHGRAYTSDDAGQSWTENRIDWNDVGQVTALIEHQGRIYAANGPYLYMSTNRGDSWNRVADAPASAALLSLGDVILAGGSGGASRSTDGGITWEIRDGFPDWVHQLHASPHGTALLIREHFNDSTVLYHSQDSGRSWQNSNLSGQFINDVTFAGDTWYVSTRNGLFSSTDDGATWQAAPGITPFPREVYSLEATDDGLLAGVAGLGIWKRAGEAGSWEYASQGSFPIGVAQVETIPEGLFALSLKENQLYFRAANSATWEMRHYPLSEKPGGFLLDERRLYLATTGAVLVSADGGASWDRESTGFSGTEVCQVMARSGQWILSGVKGRGLMISKDFGSSWIRFPEPISIDDWYQFLVVGASLYAATSSGLYVSTNDGEIWKKEREPTSAHAMYRLALWSDEIVVACNDGIWTFNPAQSSWSNKYIGPAYAIAATRAGIFAITRDDRVIRFSRELDTYEPFNEGLPDVGFVSPNVCRAELKEIDGRLYIGACSLPGLFSLDLSNLTSVDQDRAASDEMFIASPWPSPAVNRTSIEWSIPTAGYVQLELTDLLGRVLTTLASGTFDAGRHVSSLNTTGLPGGAYLCRLIFGGRQTSRVIVID